MILKEHTEDINSYIDTMNNIKMAIKIATSCLIELLKITEEERITA